MFSLDSAQYESETWIIVSKGYDYKTVLSLKAEMTEWGKVLEWGQQTHAPGSRAAECCHRSSAAS